MRQRTPRPCLRRAARRGLRADGGGGRALKVAKSGNASCSGGNLLTGVDASDHHALRATA